MALLLRMELFSPGPTIMTADQYNQVMTYHGAIMVFMVIIPGIPAIYSWYEKIGYRYALPRVFYSLSYFYSSILFLSLLV